VTSPVLAALANAKAREEREQEQILTAATYAHLGLPVPRGDKSQWPAWKQFADKQGIVALPALPAAIAIWILNHASLGDRLVKVVESISAVHQGEGAADPTRSDVVIAALAKVAPVEAPRSWDAAHKIMFARLPRDLQVYVNKRATEDSKAVRQAQNRKDKSNGHSQSTTDTAADAQRAH
jgi:hypothetical protein